MKEAGGSCSLSSSMLPQVEDEQHGCKIRLFRHPSKYFWRQNPAFLVQFIPSFVCVCVCVTCSPPRSEVGKRSVRVCLPLSEREVNDSEREAGLRLQSAFDRRVWLVSDIERA